MTDDHYESLRRHILDLRVEIEELKLLIKQMIKAQRQGQAVPEAAAYLDTIAEIDIPDDIKKLLGNQN